jgi:hypothetical protein
MRPPIGSAMPLGRCSTPPSTLLPQRRRTHCDAFLGVWAFRAANASSSVGTAPAWTAWLACTGRWHAPASSGFACSKAVSRPGRRRASRSRVGRRSSVPGVSPCRRGWMSRFPRHGCASIPVTKGCRSSTCAAEMHGSGTKCRRRSRRGTSRAVCHSRRTGSSATAPASGSLPPRSGAGALREGLGGAVGVLAVGVEGRGARRRGRRRG